jgi:transcription antitermination factor NusG
VFVPSLIAFDLPHVPSIAYGFMRGAEFELIRVPDRQLEPMRKLADKPLIPARRLPKAGQKVRFTQGPFEGLRGRVVSCTIRACHVAVEGFAQAIQAPPVLLAVD